MSPFWKYAILLISLCCFSLLVLRWLSRKPYFSLFATPITHLDREQAQVALTFDDGPSPSITPLLLDLLAQHQVKATFFVNGIHLKNHPAIARRALAEGHLLANHTYDHERMVFRSQAFILDDLQKTDRLIQDCGQAKIDLYRPTYGDKFINLPRVLKQEGKAMITWDVNPSAQYSGHFDSKKVVDQVMEQAKNGSIIVLHDSPSWSTPPSAFLNAVEEIILNLKQKGMRFVVVTEGMR